MTWCVSSSDRNIVLHSSNSNVTKHDGELFRAFSPLSPLVHDAVEQPGHPPRLLLPGGGAGPGAEAVTNARHHVGLLLGVAAQRPVHGLVCSVEETRKTRTDFVQRPAEWTGFDINYEFAKPRYSRRGQTNCSQQQQQQQQQQQLLQQQLWQFLDLRSAGEKGTIFLKINIPCR